MTPKEPGEHRAVQPPHRAWWGALAFFVCLAGLVICRPTPGKDSADAPLMVLPAPPAPPTPTRSPAPSPSSERPQQEEPTFVCPNERQRLFGLQESCQSELRAAGCTFHANSAISGALPITDYRRRCPALPTDAIVADCRQLPCVAAISPDGVDALHSCDISLTNLLGAWGDHTLFSFKPLDQELHAERRRAIEWMLSTNLRIPILNDSYDFTDCSTLSTMTSCEDLARSNGCPFPSPDDLLARLRDTQHHIDAAETLFYDLLDSCDAFAEAEPFLDCEEMPCVIGLKAPPFDMDDPKPSDYLACDRLRTSPQVTVPSEFGTVALWEVTRLPDTPDWILQRPKQPRGYRIGGLSRWYGKEKQTP